MTVEHLQHLLDHPKDLRLFFQVAVRLERGQVPESPWVVAGDGGRCPQIGWAQAGCECISHVLQALTELNPNATILSVDGMSAYDMMSRKAMLQGLSNVEGGRGALPFVSMFYGTVEASLARFTPSTKGRWARGCIVALF